MESPPKPNPRDARQRKSLQREWARAFSIILGLLLVSAVTAGAGIHIVVTELESSARTLQLETTEISHLRTAIVNHEQVAHKLLSNEPVNRSEFEKNQKMISRLFAKDATLFSPGSALAASFQAARDSWQAGLTRYGLWGAQIFTLRGNHSIENPTYGASSDATVAILAGLGGPLLDVMGRGISKGGLFERDLLILLGGLFLLALATTELSRRKMIKSLLRPLSILHDGAQRLESGDYEHRIAISRHDEIGDLDEAFNAMAEAMRQSQQDLAFRATHDALTGLANRFSLVERLSTLFGPDLDRRKKTESLLYLDIDDFKFINDRLGHDGGDALLIEIAQRLARVVRPGDLVARLGGDEFAIVVSEDRDGLAATEIAERITQEMAEPVIVSGKPVGATMSIGIVHDDGEVDDFAELLRRADYAMYRAKHLGKGRYERYNPIDEQARVAES